MEDITNTEVSAESTSYGSMDEAADAAIKSFESSQGKEQASQPQNVSQPAAPSLTDISKLEKFMYEGKELTPAELKKMIMFQQDYTKKTQDYSKSKKEFDSVKSEYEKSKEFQSNLAIDLENVSKNPELASKFMEVYPKEYHKLLGYLQKQEQQEKVQNDPRIEKLETAYQELHEEKVEKASLEIDNAFKEFSQKYPLSNETDVVAALDRILDNKIKQAEANGENTRRVALDKSDYEKCFKASNDYHNKRYEQHYSKQFNNQKDANQLAKSPAAGGGTASNAPQKIKTFRDAELAAEEAMRSGSF